jgi:hypothetical protein
MKLDAINCDSVHLSGVIRATKEKKHSSSLKKRKDKNLVEDGREVK